MWRKRPTGWVVVEGDTGWVNLTHVFQEPWALTSGRIEFRRINDTIWASLSKNVSGNANNTVTLPNDWKSSLTEIGVILNSEARQFRVFGGAGSDFRIVSGNTTNLGGLLSWPTNNRWPTTL